MKQMINDLDDIDFLKDVFQIKMNIADGSNDQKLDAATRSGNLFAPKGKGMKDIGE